MIHQLRKIKRSAGDLLYWLVKERLQANILDIIPSLVEYNQSSPSDRQSYYDHTKNPILYMGYYLELRRKLSSLGIPVEDVVIDIAAFKEWLKQSPELTTYYKMTNDGQIEKCLEHYLTYTYLGMKKGDICIDIAAAGSPWAKSARSRGIITWRLDLLYRKGIHGYDIGGDAGNMCLPDNYVDVMTLHCAYECFMGDADIKFIGEASRVLKTGGRCGIVPLYLDETYFNSTSPLCSQDKVTIDSDARRVWRDDHHAVPFSRHYSPEALKNRIISIIPENMKCKVLFFNNLIKLNELFNFPEQRIYAFFMLLLNKTEPTK